MQILDWRSDSLQIIKQTTHISHGAEREEYFGVYSARLQFSSVLTAKNRSLLGFAEPEPIPALQAALAMRSDASKSLPFILFHLSLAPLSSILRMGLGINKYLVIVMISGDARSICLRLCLQLSSPSPAEVAASPCFLAVVVIASPPPVCRMYARTCAVGRRPAVGRAVPQATQRRRRVSLRRKRAGPGRERRPLTGPGKSMRPLSNPAP